MGQVKFLDQPAQALSFLNRIQVFALQILDQRNRCGLLVVYVPNDCGYFGKPCNLRSTPAALVSAVAFTFAPFALRELLLYGGNVPQYLSIAFFPWTLWAATKAVNTNKWGWVALTAIFYAAIMLSHLFQAFIFFAGAGAVPAAAFGVPL